jgi:hypothetical protein
MDNTTTENSLEMTPGYKTTEFYQTLIATIVPNLITLLVLSKLIPSDTASALTSALVAVINGIVTLWVTIKYQQTRAQVKGAFFEAKRYVLVERSRNELARAQLPKASA